VGVAGARSEEHRRPPCPRYQQRGSPPCAARPHEAPPGPLRAKSK